MENSPHIVVAGAGTIGCFVGGLLAAAGHDVTLLARPRILNEIRAHGLTLTGFDGMAQKVDADAVTLTDKPGCLADADVILVTVRSGDSYVMARTIAARAAPHAKIISLQNGAGNTDILRAALPNMDVRAGVVPFYVIPMGQGCFHRTSSGDILIEAGEGGFCEVLSGPHLKTHETAQITGIQWGRFLMNLNNAVNALSGLTLQEQLNNRDWRKLLADQWDEAMRVLIANEIKPLLTTRIPARFVPMILRLPTPIFVRTAAFMLAINTQARTSMSHDLMAKRETEIDTLQGQVVRMGAKVGRTTPISAMVIDVIKLAQTAGEGLPNLSVQGLRCEI